MAKFKSSDRVESSALEPGSHPNTILSSIKAHRLEKGNYDVLDFQFKNKKGNYLYRVFDPTNTTANEDQRKRLQADTIEEASSLLKEERIKEAVTMIMYFAEKVSGEDVDMDVEIDESFDWDRFCIDAQNLFSTNYSEVELWVNLTGNVYKGKARVQFPKYPPCSCYWL